VETSYSNAHDSRLDGSLPYLETKLLRKPEERRESIESFYDGGGIFRRVQERMRTLSCVFDIAVQEIHDALEVHSRWSRDRLKK